MQKNCHVLFEWSINAYLGFSNPLVVIDPNESVWTVFPSNNITLRQIRIRFVQISINFNSTFQPSGHFQQKHHGPDPTNFYLRKFMSRKGRLFTILPKLNFGSSKLGWHLLGILHFIFLNLHPFYFCSK